MKVAAVVTDLMLYSRIESAASVAGVALSRVDTPSAVPPDAELILVDWTGRQADWAEALRERSGSRVILFGPHIDLAAHAAAREAHLGPMWARSRLISRLPTLLAEGGS